MPVLVLWGPGAPDFEQGWQRVSDVVLFSGRQEKQWRALVAAGTSRPEATDVAATAVRDFVRRQDAALAR